MTKFLTLLLIALPLFMNGLGCLEEPDVEERSDAVSCTLSEADYWISVQKTDIFISAVHTGAEIDEFRLNADPDALFCTHFENENEYDIVVGYCNRNEGELRKKKCSTENMIASCVDDVFHVRYFIDSSNNLEAHQTECETDHDIWTEF